MDLDIYSNIGSDLVQDNAAYKKESDSLEQTIGSLFNESYLALETMNDPHLREIRDCVQQKDWPRLKEFEPTFHKLRDSLSNTNGVLCLDEKIVVPKKLRIKFLNLLYAAHPGQLGMNAAAEYMW